MLSSRFSKLKRAISTAVTAIIVVVIIVIIAAGGYYALTLPKGSSSTTTSTTTSVLVTTTSSTSSITSTTTTPTTTTTTTSTQNLTALAEAEGSLTVYTTVDANAFNSNITAAFTKAYPWAKVNVVSDTSGNILNKALAEAKSGSVQADVVQNVGADFTPLENISALLSYPNPEEHSLGYPTSILDPNNYTHPFDITEYMLCYNTNLVKDPSTLPTSWLDLTNSQWSGKIVFDDPSRLSATGGLFAILSQNMTHSAWISYLQGVEANKPFIVSSSGGVYTDVSDGTAAIGDCAATDVIASLSSGAPVSYVWLNPVPVNSAPIAIMKGAPHPYMAQLFIQWIDSPEGQAAIGGSSRSPALPSVAATSFLNRLPTPIPSSYAEVNFIPLLSVNGSQWTTVYTSIFGA
jgi:iron(III) transport system substrate-binding protein